MDLWLTIIWGIIGIVAILTGFLFYIYKKHDYKIRIREITSDKTRLITDTVAKISTDNEKIEYLRLFSKTHGHRDLPLPPPEAIDYDPKKKKKVVELYYSPEMGYVYLMDEKTVHGFQPLTTKQRAMLVNQIRKKESRKITTWREHIPLIVGLTALVVIIAVILLFWGEAMQPMITLGDRIDLLLDKVNLCSATTGQIIPPA